MTNITETLRAARACIQQDRTILADTGMRHDNTMEPDAAAGVAEYDAVLQQIDAALAGMTHHITDEQIAKLHDSMFPAPYDGHANVVRLARAVLALAAPQGEPVAVIDGGCLMFTCKSPLPDGTELYTAPAPAVPSDERAAFEAWARPHGYDLRRNDVLGHYSSLDTLRAWEGWQARAALTAAPTPPAQPAVPEDVARDAERYRWLRDMASQDWLHRNHNYQNLRGAAFDAAIDAARAAEKGGV